jgi:hypothetical protein
MLPESSGYGGRAWFTLLVLTGVSNEKKHQRVAITSMVSGSSGYGGKAMELGSLHSLYPES